MKYLERNEIIHRDIKPANIIFRNRNCDVQDFCLIDFGLSIFVNSKY